jgi:hypothetical protein
MQKEKYKKSGISAVSRWSPNPTAPENIFIAPAFFPAVDCGSRVYMESA